MTEETTPFITLAQFLKVHNIAATGGQAKHRARAGDILVNGEPEARPGRKLRKGDTVTVDGKTLPVTMA